ncbi:MAG: HTH domain-containing protein [Anaerolineae bacterium]|jgi:proteasome accessory factor B|nr:HTH domain-containing protein [Anaerolineae bacterium]
MSLSNRSERLTFIEQLLFRKPDGLRVVELAQVCQVDRRTIYRDLSLLQTMGIPVYQQNGRYYIHRDYYQANLRLSLNEIISLLLAVRSFVRQQEKHNPFLLAILHKLSAILPDFPAEHTQKLVNALWSSPIDSAYIQVLETVIRGWCERKLIKLWDGEKIYQFETYFIEPNEQGSLHLNGFDRASQQRVILKLERLKRAKMLQFSYVLPNDFNLAYQEDPTHS